MLVAIALVVFFATAISVPLVAHILTRKGILDQPRVQSSHDIPTPRGGGLAVMPIIFIGWLWLALSGIYTWPDRVTFLVVIACGIFLCAFTWIDDHRPQGLRVRWRLLGQLIAVSLPLILMPSDMGRLLPGAPIILERVLMAIAWVWFSNLFNFMDGVNGISGMEAISITGALLIFCYFAPIHVPAGFPILLVIPLAAAAGFLVWNARPVARVFLGDVGSIGLGYCLAWLLFTFAGQNYMMPAILISLVYSMDATVTLLKRAWQKKKIWEAHREHFYHRATVKGALSHLSCVGIIFFVNILLMLLGLGLMYSLMRPIFGLALGLILVTSLLVFFYQYGRKKGHKSSPRPKPFKIERLGRVFIRRRLTGRR